MTAWPESLALAAWQGLSTTWEARRSGRVVIDHSPGCSLPGWWFTGASLVRSRTLTGGGQGWRWWFLACWDVHCPGAIFIRSDILADLASEGVL